MLEGSKTTKTLPPIGFFEKIWGFITSPTDTFYEVREEGWGSAIGYLAKVLLIPAILIAVIILAFIGVIGSFVSVSIGIPGLEGWGPALENLIAMAAGTLALIALISVIVGGLIGILVGSLWMHIWVYVVGGRKGVGQTIKAMAYGSTPALVLGWIPFLGVLFGLLSIWVSITGIRELHDISTGRASLAYVLGAIMIPLIIYFAFLGTLLTTFFAGLPLFI